jgi:hypothetical protein
MSDTACDDEGGLVRRAAAVGLALVLIAGCQQGHRPDTAAVPTGPSSGLVRVSYTFSSSALCHDGDDVAIRFDWGDGDTSDWSSWVRPGDTVTMSHSWAQSGTFNVRARAKARNITVSDWSASNVTSIYHGWTKAFGSAGGEEGRWVQETRDGGYIIAGGAGGDVWLIKTDVMGDTLWTRTFGEAGDDEVGYSVRQTSDGGYVVVGYTESYPRRWADVFLVRADSEGHQVWARTFGGAEPDHGNSVQQTRDGGYIIAGSTESFGAGGSDVWLLKTDANGDTIWARTFGGIRDDEGYSVQQTSDGGYVIAGYTESFVAGGGWLIKTDASGNRIWDRVFGVAGVDLGMSVQQTTDGGYVIGGQVDCYGSGANEVWLAKTDAVGGVTWTKTFGGPGYDCGYAAEQTRDGGYVVAGYTESYGAGNGDVWLVRCDANGDTMWTRTFGGGNVDVGMCVQQTRDGGFVVTGRTLSYGAGDWDVLLIKTDAEGRVHEGLGK